MLFHKYRNEFRAGLLLVLWITSVPASLWAQSAMAELRGTIVDQSEAVVPGSTVSVQNVGTGVVRTTKTNEAGVYSVPDLSPAIYEVTVSAPGFATERMTNVTLTVGAQQVLNFKLSAAQVNSIVEVTSAAPPIELASSALGGVEDAKTTRELPLNGRDWTQLATLQPGVTTVNTQNTLNGSSSNRGSRGFGTELSINGGRPTQNSYFLDGVSQNDYANASPGNVLGLTLGVDAIQEFSVLTSDYNASYGQTSAGVINAVTRSGTNQFHGDAYEFLRNDILDARNFFDITKPPFRRNQFGLAAGAPIKKDKTFIFANYEGLRQALTTTSIAIVPSVAARQGNLSTGKVTVSTAVAPFLALWPLPNDGLLGAGDTGQYLFTAKTPSSENFGALRLDQFFSSSDSMAVTYNADDGQTQVPDALNSIFANSTLRRNTASVHETHIFSPNVLNQFRLGFNRVTAHALYTSPGNNPAADTTALGILPGRDAPVITVSGLTSFTGGVGGLAATNFAYTTYQLYDDLSIQKGTHAMKTGFSFERYYYNLQVASDPNGEYDFSSLSSFLTNGRPATFFADLSYSGTQTTGVPSSTGYPERGFRQNVIGGYFLDDIRLRENLTLNLGLRYEMSTVPYEQYNRVSSLRDIYSTNLNIGQPLFQNPTHLNFEPRVGLAWDPFRDGKTSIRSGFGIFDMLPLLYEYALLESYGAPFSDLASIVNPPAGLFPYGGYQALVSGQPVPVRVPSVQYNPRRNYVMQWNFSVQRSIAPNTTLLIAYSGSRGVHMPEIINDVDIVVPALTPAGYLWPSPAGSGTKLNPTYGAIRQISWGTDAFYDGLQTRIQKRFSRGFQLQGSFTWQKSIDEYSSSSFPTTFQNSTSVLGINPKLNRGVSDFDIGKVGVIDGLWELPKTDRGLPIIQWAVNGWELGGIFSASDGLPFTPLISGDATGQLSSSTYDVPNVVDGPACTNLTNPRNPNNYINLACYSFPNPRTLLGNAGRNSLFGAGLAELDFSLIRNFALPFIAEGSHLQFRAEAFNIANRANFEPPIPNNKLYNATGVPIASAGIITSTATTSRQIQFALKLVW